MGAFADLRSNRKSFAVGSALDQWLVSELARKADPPVEALAAAVVEVQSMATATQTSGGMTLTFSIQQADKTFESFTTAAVAFDETAAATETLIDSAATTASITGWTNGDISVSGTAVDDGPIVFTFDGASVTLNNGLTVLVDVDGAGGAWGAITQTTAGQTVRNALSILLSYGILTGTIPEQDAPATLQSFTKGTAALIPAHVVKSLMKEAAVEDANNSTYFSLESALMPQDRAPLIESRYESDGVIRRNRQT
jgi:hypothetical protein